MSATITPNIPPVSDDLEKYLKGIPLTPELEALDGRLPEELQQTAAITGELDDDERGHLRRLTFEAGWGVLFKLLDTAIQRQNDLAVGMSMNDPLGNRDAIAREWAYLAMMKRVRTLLLGRVQEEIAMLERK